MTVSVSLSVDHEEGHWDRETRQAEPAWGWAVIRLGSREIGRAELDYHEGSDRDAALNHAAARWLQRCAKPGSSQLAHDPAERDGAGRRYDITVPSPLLDCLEPGVTVERELTSFTEEKGITTAVPCCGRRIILPICDPKQESPAVCCRCHATYRVSLHEELTGYDDGPFRTAIFAMESRDVAVARHRSGR
jgi:hypothetical protein